MSDSKTYGDVSDVSAPVWADPSQTKIIVDVSIAGYSGSFKFLASGSDPEQHGRDIYHDIMQGLYGPIAPYVAPPAPPTPPKKEGPPMVLPGPRRAPKPEAQQ